MKEEWKDIPGFAGRYQISKSGDVRRINENGKATPRQKFYKPIDGKKVAFIMLHEGKKAIPYRVTQLLALTFIGPCPSGYVAHYKDSSRQEESLDNIQYIKISEYAKLKGVRWPKRPVLKINEKGKIVGRYSSARECCRDSKVSYPAIIDRCNGKCEKTLATDGFTYVWADDSEGLWQAIDKIKKQRIAGWEEKEMKYYQNDQEIRNRVHKIKVKFQWGEYKGSIVFSEEGDLMGQALLQFEPEYVDLDHLEANTCNLKADFENRKFYMTLTNELGEKKEIAEELYNLELLVVGISIAECEDVEENWF